MSDEDRDIDIESDVSNDVYAVTDDEDLSDINCKDNISNYKDDDDSVTGTGRTDLQFASQAEKRAHHNALERKRRDHIKDSFCSLRDSVPSLAGEKVKSKASRAQILKKAADYIDFMRKKHNAHQQDIDDLKRQNNLLETQIRALEKTRYTGNFAAMANSSALSPIKSENSGNYEDSGSDSDSDINTHSKRMKT